ncbi:hypothetical protein QM565_30465 [Geitlerinema splendidum]|nr:hypothetical protein [Geitlerinema splendidum]
MTIYWKWYAIAVLVVLAIFFFLPKGRCYLKSNQLGLDISALSWNVVEGECRSILPVKFDDSDILYANGFSESTFVDYVDGHGTVYENGEHSIEIRTLNESGQSIVILK